METGNPWDLYHGSVWFRARKKKKKTFGRGRQNLEGDRANYPSITFKQTSQMRFDISRYAPSCFFATLTKTNQSKVFFQCEH